MKLFTVFLLVLAALFTSTTFAEEEPLTNLEQFMLESFLAGDDAMKASVREAYWLTLQNEIVGAQNQLPIRVSEHVVLVKVVVREERLTYIYMVTHPKLTYDSVKLQMIPNFCNDEQMMLFMGIFEGTFSFVYLLKHNPQDVHAAFVITASDCGAF